MHRFAAAKRGGSIQRLPIVGILLVILTAVLAGSCGRGPQQRLARADELYRKGDYNAAALEYRKVIQSDPNNGLAYLGYGRCRLRLGEAPEAAGAFSEAVRLMPDHEEAAAALADVLLAAYTKGNTDLHSIYDRLSELSDRLLIKDPASFQGLRIKGYLAVFNRQPERAIEYFQKALSRKPMDPEVVLILSQTLLENKRAAEGEKLAADFVVQRPDYYPVGDVLYRHYLKTKRVGQAQKLLEDRIQANPKQAAPIVQLAEHFARHNDEGRMKSTLARLTSDPKTYPGGHAAAAELLERLNRWEEAAALYQEGMKAEPDRKLDYLRKTAALLNRHGRREEALQAAQEVLRAKPDDAWARQFRALWILDNKQVDRLPEALQDLQALEKKSPDNSGLQFHLGRAYLAAGKAQEAKQAFAKAARDKNFLPPRTALAELSAQAFDYRALMIYAEEMLQANPNNPRARLFRIVARVGLGETKQAAEEMQKLLRDFPNYGEAQFEAGFVYMAENKWKEAEAAFRKFYKPGQADLRPLRALVSLWERTRSFDVALKTLEAERKANPGSLEVLELLGSVAASAGKPDVAVAALREAAGRNPRSVTVALRLADAYMRQGDLGQAAAVARKAVELAPKNIYALQLLAQVQNASNQHQEAIQTLRRAMDADPGNPFLANNLSYFLARQGVDLDKALQLAQKAVSGLNNDPTALDTLGYVYLRKGQKDAAIQVFRSLVAKFPDSATYNHHLGMALLEKGDRAEARKALAKALEGNPTPDQRREIEDLLRRAS
jgi:tetratricopeptide (TPR) repeat protein